MRSRSSASGTECHGLAFFKASQPDSSAARLFRAGPRRRRWAWFCTLRRRPFLTGPLFGLVAYGVMNYIVIPLSAAASGGTPPVPVLLNGLLIHAFGVGLPAALFARAAFGRG